MHCFWQRFFVFVTTTIFAFGSLHAERQVSAPFELPIGLLTCKFDNSKLVVHATLFRDRDLIITSGHFADSINASEVTKLRRCEFFIPKQGSTPQFRSTIVSAELGGSKQHRTISRAVDWAVLKLERNAPTDLPPMRVANNVNDHELAKIQLLRFRSPGNVGLGLNRSGGCNAGRTFPGSKVIQHECKTEPGVSGAPMIIFREHQIYIAAVHSGATEKKRIAVLLEGRPQAALPPV